MTGLFLGIQYIGILIIIMEIIFVMRQKSSDIQRDMLILHLSMLITFIAYTVEIKSTCLEEAIIGVKFGYLGKPVLILSMFYLIVDYCNVRVAQWVRSSLLIIQMLFTLVVFTFEKHGLFYKNVRLATEDVVTHVAKERGILYNIYTGVIIIYTLTMLGICIWKLVTAKTKRQRTILSIFVLIVIVPFLSFAIYFLPVFKGYDTTLLGYLFASLAFSFIFMRLDVFAAIAMAKEQVIEHIKVGLYVFDYNGTLVYMNDKAKELKLDNRLEELYKAREYYMSGGYAYRVNQLPVNGDGLSYGYVYYVSDETETYHYEQRLQAEKMRADEASRAKTEFLSSMSHDIRTPMNAILGMTKIASYHMDDRARVEDCLDKINISGNHLIELINEVLDMNKIESGKIELNEDNFDLVTLLDEIVVMSRPLIEGKNHTLKMDGNDITHSYVRGDKSRLSQVFMNLISNAVKYTNEGGLIEVVMKEVSANEEEANYTIMVRDNGIGMSKDYLPTLFDPFTRAKDENVNKAQGTGLGMAITKQFTELMGGDIKVSSTLGVGTTFTIIIPFKLADPNENNMDDEMDIADINFDGKRVLLVEDNDINAEIAGEILEMAGLTVEFAEDGTEAVAKMEEVEDAYYDLIFMDVQMPKMDGYEATKVIRAMDREYARKVPIVAMTANAFAEDVIAAKEAGMNSHIAKPLDYAKLLDVLKEYMR